LILGWLFHHHHHHHHHQHHLFLLSVVLCASPRKACGGVLVAGAYSRLLVDLNSKKPLNPLSIYISTRHTPSPFECVRNVHVACFIFLVFRDGRDPFLSLKYTQLVLFTLTPPPIFLSAYHCVLTRSHHTTHTTLFLPFIACERRAIVF
jgi:hypothetical protein